MEASTSSRKKISEVWNFFNPLNKNQAICKLCKNKLSHGGSPSNLKKHISCKHPTVKLAQSSNNEVLINHITEETPVIVLEPATTTIINSDLITESSNPDRLLPALMCPSTSGTTKNDSAVPLYTLPGKRKQTTVTSYIPKKITATEKNNIDMSIMKMIVWDFQPFSVVEDRGFRNLMAVCVPTYSIPSRKYFANTMLPALYEETRCTIKESLETDATSVCLTTDAWTSSKNDSFMAITGHYLTAGFEMKSVLLQCSEFDESHTSQNLADEILSAIEEWGIRKKINMIVSDNCSNISGAIKTVLKMKHYGCYAHKLNLVVQDSLPLVNGVITKVKTIVSHFKRSNKAVQKLIKYQELQGIRQPKRLLQDIVTRWNSTFYMLQRFVDLEEAIKHSLAILTTNLTPLTADEWEICKELCDLLRPYEEVIKEMSSEKYLNASKVIPITRGLKSATNRILDKLTKPIVKDVANALLIGCEERFPNLEKRHSFILCTFLDPRYKHHMFLEESTVSKIKKLVIELLTGLINETRNKSKPSGEVTDDEPEAEGEPKEKNISVWDDVEDVINKVKPKTNSTSIAIQEVQRYMDDSPISRKKDPLEWWKNNEKFFPNLAKVVIRNCGIVSTSVPCERVFSKAGYFLGDRRTRLSTSKLNQLVFLNSNLK